MVTYLTSRNMDNFKYVYDMSVEAQTSEK